MGPFVLRPIVTLLIDGYQRQLLAVARKHKRILAY